MPDGLATALMVPGLVWVVLVTFVAGVVYGFAGFGAALIFMPVAVVFLEPPLAVAAFSVSAVISLFTVVPRAWRECDRPATVQLIIAASVTASIGLYGLANFDVTLVRWLVLGVTTVTLLALIAGWRRQTDATTPARLGIGAATGLVGGLTGLMGPIVVLFQLSSADGAGRSRANTIVFLTVTSILLLPLMALQGVLTGAAIWLGMILLPAYGLGTVLGQKLFTPGSERVYRTVAYGIIAAAIALGLPIWE
ncbi:sulfite exporter TauE/SafE family protein [Shimia ponticola]|uniref:sulfite exporter TauE/SafE family protein n=1 Tax=Shimia ponticola TaxID=2582893 RepID=UPI0011BFD656|nr:sulfite exporter TauE/SafE family protein [Shimia ponticola]